MSCYVFITRKKLGKYSKPGIHKVLRAKKKITRLLSTIKVKKK